MINIILIKKIVLNVKIIVIIVQKNNVMNVKMDIILNKNFVKNVFNHVKNVKVLKFV